MSQVHDYEVTAPNGTVTTMQLTEEDAKRFTNARKVTKQHKAPADKAEPPAHGHEQVQNRSRR